MIVATQAKLVAAALLFTMIGGSVSSAADASVASIGADQSPPPPSWGFPPLDFKASLLAGLVRVPPIPAPTGEDISRSRGPIVLSGRDELPKSSRVEVPITSLREVTEILVSRSR